MDFFFTIASCWKVTMNIQAMIEKKNMLLFTENRQRQLEKKNKTFPSRNKI